MAINIGNTSTAATDAQKRDINDGIRRDAVSAFTTNTTLIRNNHANIMLEVNSANPVTLTLPTTSTVVVGDRFFGINQGAGVVSVVLNGGGAIVGNAILPATLDQYSPFEVWYTSLGYRRVA